MVVLHRCMVVLHRCCTNAIFCTLPFLPPSPHAPLQALQAGAVDAQGGSDALRPHPAMDAVRIVAQHDHALFVQMLTVVAARKDPVAPFSS